MGSSGKYWFRRKKYGWGWEPNTWQGWLITIIFILGFFVPIWLLLEPHQGDEIPARNLWLFFAILFADFGLFIAILYWRGPKPPRWQWGDEDGKSN